jgi:hypothetical protein
MTSPTYDDGIQRIRESSQLQPETRGILSLLHRPLKTVGNQCRKDNAYQYPKPM